MTSANVSLAVHGVVVGQDLWGSEPLSEVKRRYLSTLYTSAPRVREEPAGEAFLVELLIDEGRPYVAYSYLRYGLAGYGNRPNAYLGMTLFSDLYFSQIGEIYHLFRFLYGATVSRELLADGRRYRVSSLQQAASSLTDVWQAVARMIPSLTRSEEIPPAAVRSSSAAERHITDLETEPTLARKPLEGVFLRFLDVRPSKRQEADLESLRRSYASREEEERRAEAERQRASEQERSDLQEQLRGVSQESSELRKAYDELADRVRRIRELLGEETAEAPSRSQPEPAGEREVKEFFAQHPAHSPKRRKRWLLVAAAVVVLVMLVLLVIFFLFPQVWTALTEWL